VTVNKNDGLNIYRSYTISLLLNIVKLVERSTYTYYHSDRVASISYLIGKRLGLPDRELAVLWRAALLHDIGKIGVRNTIVMKKGKLTEDEYNEIKKHPQYGGDILKPIPFFTVERVVIKQHHERWNGSGYPDGLEGKNIHLFARILGITDVLDSLISDRPYRETVGFYNACQYIRDNSNILFDPDLVKVFRDLVDDNSILGKYKYFANVMKNVHGDWIVLDG